MSRKRIRELADEMGQIELSTWEGFNAVVDECSEVLRELAPVKRRLFFNHVIMELYEEQGGICALCPDPLDLNRMHVDHRIPFSRGGGNERGNLQLAHPSCNQQKGNDVDRRDLLVYLESRYMNL